MDKSGAANYFPALFPFLFIGMWCTICLVLSRIGGWRRMAERFPARDLPTGTRYWMQSARIGGVNYNGCLTIHNSPNGLYLSVWLPFRLGHPPVFIPWSAVQNATTRKVLWSEIVVFDVGSPRIAQLQLSKKVFGSQKVLR